MKSGGVRGSFPIRGTLPMKSQNIVFGKNRAQLRSTEANGSIIRIILGMTVGILIILSPSLIWMLPRAHALVSAKEEKRCTMQVISYESYERIQEYIENCTN